MKKKRKTLDEDEEPLAYGVAHVVRMCLVVTEKASLFKADPSFGGMTAGQLHQFLPDQNECRRALNDTSVV